MKLILSLRDLSLTGLALSKPNFVNFSAARESRRIPQFLYFSANRYTSGRIERGMLGGWFTKKEEEKENYYKNGDGASRNYQG